jgi:hypothetical protein
MKYSIAEIKIKRELAWITHRSNKGKLYDIGVKKGNTLTAFSLKSGVSKIALLLNNCEIINTVINNLLIIAVLLTIITLDSNKYIPGIPHIISRSVSLPPA